MSHRIVILSALATSLASMSSAHAFDIGLEANLRVESTDNVGGLNEGLEEDGQFGFASFEVYGEQRGSFLQVGFTGEVETQKLLSDSDSDLTTLNNFFGAANLTLSRTFSWYFGDVLGSVRTADDFVPLDNDELSTRRNVFVTGPSFDIDLSSDRQITGELLYFNQDQDDVDLAQLFTAQFEFRQDTRRGNTFGFNFSDFFADEPSGSDGDQIDFDSNRLSASVFWERSRGRLSWFASVGATQFDVEDETINGANADFRLTRNFTATSNLTFALGTDLSDSNISTIDSLLSGGVGVEPEAAGIFQLNSASLTYSFAGAGSSYQVGARVEDAEFELLALGSDVVDAALVDNVTVSIFGTFSNALTTRLSFDANVLIEEQQFDNLPDDLTGVTASVSLAYKLTQSFSITGGLRTAHSQGIDTQQAILGASPDGAFDITETRAVLGLRWAPPSRASRETVVQLRQLLR